MSTKRVFIALMSMTLLTSCITLAPEFLGTFNHSVSIWRNPEDQVLYYQRGQLRQMYGNHRGAVSDFNEVVKIATQIEDSSIDPAASYASRGQAYYLLANSPFLRREKKKEYCNLAIVDYRKAAELFRKSDNSSSADIADQKIKFIGQNC
ncbi:MAG: hypothetical protein AAF622_01800 [Cyanobacteria bacterium P01_C01_bin.147]